MVKKFLVVLLSLTMAISLVACGGGKGETNEGDANQQKQETEKKDSSSSKSPVAGKKVAYILNLASSDIFQLCADQCKATAEKLGMTCDVFFSNGEDAKWQDYISTCASSGYDGVFVSHGGQDYSYTFLSDIVKQYPDFKIVAFDTQFKDGNGETKKIDGVTQFFQDDAGFATSLLDYICDDIAPDKKPVNVLKVWVGPNYLSPFDRREVGYAEYEKSGKINTVETIGPTDYNNAESSMTDVMTSTLAKYKDGDIDAVWVTYDAYGRGVYTALKEANSKIPMVSVDICNTDIQFMKEENSNWKACACTDFKANGEMAIRILALELNNEYDKIIDPKTGKKSDWLEMPVSVIAQDSLKEDTTLENLYDVAPDTYGSPKNLVTSDWIKEAIGY